MKRRLASWRWMRKRETRVAVTLQVESGALGMSWMGEMNEGERAGACVRFGEGRDVACALEWSVDLCGEGNASGCEWSVLARGWHRGTVCLLRAS